MQTSDIPAKFVKPFAYAAGGGYIRAIPETTVDPGAASLAQGFPPLTFQPVASGGQPPDGRDFNGLLNQATAWAWWVAAGGPIFYDAGFVAENGGYPRYAVLASTTPGGFWQSTVDNNTTNPDSGGANWIAVVPATATAAEVLSGVSSTKYIAPSALATAIGNGVGESVTLPGGRIIKQGSYSALISAGGSVFIGFGTAFPNACTSVSALPINTSAAGNRDNFVQLIGRSTLGFSIVVQGTNTGGSQTLDGFDWQAFGY